MNPVAERLSGWSEAETSAKPHQPQRCPEELVLFLEMALIFGQELVKVMEEDAVMDGALGMTETIDSSHSRKS